MTLPSVSELTIEEKIGQMLCLGWSAPDCFLNVNAQARACLQELHVGAMVVMGRNVSPPVSPVPSMDVAGIRDMLDELQSLAKIPLLLPTDQEGGRVARFGAAPFTRMPAARVIGDRGDLDAARAAAEVTGRELAAVGINWNFAPVADINSNPDNPVIGDRSFGESPDTVAQMAVAQVQGYQRSGILACAKHFPGHGDTSADSHYELPTVSFNTGVINERELVPFRATIAAGVESVMTAHILFPALDSALPATMSHRILTGLLREQMGFSGLIATDCLEMRAIANHWGTARGATLAAKAGADILLICHTWDRQRETFHALLGAVQSGELPMERVNASVARILSVKQRLFSRPRPPIEVVGSPEHLAVRDAFQHTVLEMPTTLGAEAI